MVNKAAYGGQIGMLVSEWFHIHGRTRWLLMFVQPASASIETDGHGARHIWLKMPPVDGRPLKRKLKPLHTSIGAVPRTAGIVMTAKTDAGGDRTALQDELQAYVPGGPTEAKIR
jgi:hypothetical protein